MKLSGGQAAAFCRAPTPGIAGALLHGPDDGAVAARRRELVGSLTGAEAVHMAVERLDPSAVRRDPAALDSALRARGFFSGRSIVLVDGATDALATVFGHTLEGAAAGDVFLVVTAGALPGRSMLRRLFEAGQHLVALHIVPSTPEIAEIEARLRALGAGAGPDDSARALLGSIAAGMAEATFDRFLEVLALSALGTHRPLTAGDVAALAPSGLDAEMDAFVEAVAAGRSQDVGPVLRRVAAAGATPVGLLLGLQRHFRQLLLAASAGGGPESGMERIRPPLWGARRDAIRAQLRCWGPDRLELAARLLFETDARLRSADRAPALALVERCALRLAMLVGR